MIFLSTLSLRRATPPGLLYSLGGVISIHALLAESDQSSGAGISKQVKFLSTLSLRRATISGLRHKCAIFYFYPRSPCGERLYLVRGQRPSWGISIHALLAESDVNEIPYQGKINKFLSTLSLRRATAKVHKTVGHFCAYETTFMGIASSC